MNLRSLAALGTAVDMQSGGRFSPRHLAQAVRHAAADRRLRERAQAFALGLTRRGPSCALGLITHPCLQIIAARVAPRQVTADPT